MDMQSYLLYCERIGEELLMILREGQHELSVLKDYNYIDERTYNDIISALKRKGFVELYKDNTCIRITDNGIHHLLHEVDGLSYAGNGVLIRSFASEIEDNTDSVEAQIPPHSRYNQTQIQALSKSLFEYGFLENENALLLLFRSEGTKCNWLRNHTTLLYVLWKLLSGNGNKIPPFVMTLVRDKCLIKGDQKEDKDIQSTASKVKPFLQKEEIDLRGQYLSVFLMFENLRP